MLVKLEQFMKQLEPKDVTEEGIVMLVKPEHQKYLQLVVYQFVLIKTVEKWLREFNGVWKRRRFNVFNFRKPQKT